MTTRDDVARWRALADAATPGPWTAIADTPSGDVFIDTRLVADCIVDGMVVSESPAQDMGRNDARHIAASREAVPAMADALVEAAHIIDALLGTGRGNAAEAEAVAWLDEWRGDAPGGDA